jgi:hypothetical protein
MAVNSFQEHPLKPRRAFDSYFTFTSLQQQPVSQVASDVRQSSFDHRSSSGLIKPAVSSRSYRPASKGRGTRTLWQCLMVNYGRSPDISARGSSLLQKLLPKIGACVSTNPVFGGSFRFKIADLFAHYARSNNLYVPGAVSAPARR